MAEKGIIFNIQRYSIHDGPGVRTLIFFKGCPLACQWCSNPESQSGKRQIKFLKTLCSNCGACIAACPTGASYWKADSGTALNARRCIKCGKCLSVCPADARSWWGEEMTVDELFQKALRDRAFFKRTGGGVTLGGGDPLYQHEFAHAFLRKCKDEGVNTAMETEAFCTFDVLTKCAALCDTVFIDLKAWDSQVHKAQTGYGNEIILGNISAFDRWLDQAEGEHTWILRIPLLPDINFSLEDMKPLAEYLLSLHHVTGIEILPFHNLGESKYAQTGMTYRLLGKPNLTAGDVAEYADALRARGVEAKVVEL